MRCLLSSFALGTSCSWAHAPRKSPPRRHRPTAPTAPTASLSANPNTVEPGQSTTLTWQTTNATDVSIDGIGPVDPSGSRQVTPIRLDHLPSRRQRRRWNPGCHRSRDRQRRARSAARNFQRSPRRTLRAKRERTSTSITTNTIYAPPTSGSMQAMRSSCSSIPTSASRSRDTATSAARPNITWLSAPIAPTP
jgi:hypothetical protein